MTGSKDEWEAFMEETKFNGPPFVVAAQVDGICHANTLVDTGCSTYGLVSSRFAQRNQLKRIKIRPQSIRGFDGPATDKIEEVAKLSLDIGGNYQHYVYLYVVPKIDGHDIILGTPWMRQQNAIPLPDRSKLVFRNSGIAVPCGLGLAKMSDVLEASPISAAAFNFWRTRQAKKKNSNVTIFAASLRDIERTLRPRENTDPRTKLPVHYHDYL
ncbi:hypothetical protein V1520DRAFT_377498, partial [Lipomyces starkeyi]